MGIKDTMVYTIFLLLLDALSSIVINLLQGYSGGVLMASVAVRFMVLAFIFPLSIFLVTLFQVPGNIKVAAIASIVTYLLVPIVIFFIKDNQKNFGEMIIDLHTQKGLFVSIFVPFIIASIGNLIIFRKYFNW